MAATFLPLAGRVKRRNPQPKKIASASEAESARRSGAQIRLSVNPRYA